MFDAFKYKKVKIEGRGLSFREGSRNPSTSVSTDSTPSFIIPPPPPPSSTPRSPSSPSSIPSLPQFHPRSKLRPSCHACFELRLLCEHHKEEPLRLLLVGHNPSTHSYTSGYSYSHPSNWFWKLMPSFLEKGRGTSITTERMEDAFTIDDSTSKQNTTTTKQDNITTKQDASTIKQDTLTTITRDDAKSRQKPTYTIQPSLPAPPHRIGFLDVSSKPGSKAHEVNLNKFAFKTTLQDHVKEVQKNHPSYTGPALVAFTGVRQFRAVYPEYSKQTKRLHHGFHPRLGNVWLLPSTSGRAVISKQDRFGPYEELARVYHELIG